MTPDLFRLLVGQTLIQACMVGLRMAMPLYALKQQHSTVETGLLLACFSFANLLLAMPIGRFVDRTGLQAPWRLGVTLAVMAGLICAVFPSLWGMGLSALLVGASSGLSQVATQRHASLCVTSLQQRSELFGWMMTGPAAANFLGPLIVGLLLDYAGHAPTDRLGMAAASIFTAVLALLSMFTVLRIPNRHSASQPHETADTNPWTLLKDQRLRRVMLLNAFVFTCWDAYLLLVPILGHERGLSSSMVGLIFGSFALSAALIRPILPRLTAGISHRALLTFGTLLTALLFATYPILSAPWAYLACSILLGVGLGSLQPLLLTMLTHIVPPHQQGQALGFRLMALSASHVVMPLIFGGLGLIVGVSVLFWAAASVAAAGTAFAQTKSDDSQDP